MENKNLPCKTAHFIPAVRVMDYDKDCEKVYVFYSFFTPCATMTANDYAMYLDYITFNSGEILRSYEATLPYVEEDLPFIQKALADMPSVSPDATEAFWQSVKKEGEQFKNGELR